MCALSLSLSSSPLSRSLSLPLRRILSTSAQALTSRLRAAPSPALSAACLAPHPSLSSDVALAAGKKRDYARGEGGGSQKKRRRRREEERREGRKGGDQKTREKKKQAGGEEGNLRTPLLPLFLSPPFSLYPAVRHPPPQPRLLSAAPLPPAPALFQPPPTTASLKKLTDYWEVQGRQAAAAAVCARLLETAAAAAHAAAHVSFRRDGVCAFSIAAAAAESGAANPGGARCGQLKKSETPLKKKARGA